MPALISLVLSGIALILAIVALLMSNAESPPQDLTSTSAQSQRLTQVLKTLSFGSSKTVIATRKTSTERDWTVESFDQALAEWLHATPKAYRAVVGRDLDQARKLLGKFTPHYVSGNPAQARLEARGIMQDAARFCLVASDRDLDKDRANEPLQTALESIIELAGLTIIDPAPGTVWPPHAPGTKSRGKKVAQTDTRGLATEEYIVLEPEIQELA